VALVAIVIKTMGEDRMFLFMYHLSVLVLLLSEFPVLRATGLGSEPLMHGAIQKGGLT